MGALMKDADNIVADETQFRKRQYRKALWYERFFMIDDEDFDGRSQGLYREMCDASLSAVVRVRGYEKAELKDMGSHSIIYVANYGNVAVYLRRGFQGDFDHRRMWQHASNCNRGAVRAALKENPHTIDFWWQPVWVCGDRRPLSKNAIK